MMEAEDVDIKSLCLTRRLGHSLMTVVPAFFSELQRD